MKVLPGAVDLRVLGVVEWRADLQWAEPVVDRRHDVPTLCQSRAPHGAFTLVAEQEVAAVGVDEDGAVDSDVAPRHIQIEPKLNEMVRPAMLTMRPAPPVPPRLRGSENAAPGLITVSPVTLTRTSEVGFSIERRTSTAAATPTP